MRSDAYEQPFDFDTSDERARVLDNIRSLESKGFV